MLYILKYFLFPEDFNIDHGRYLLTTKRLESDLTKACWGLQHIRSLPLIHKRACVYMNGNKDLGKLVLGVADKKLRSLSLVEFTLVPF